MILPATGELDEALAQIASALRVPVLIAALIALLLCALEAGRFAAEMFTRARRGRGSMRTLMRHALADPGRASVIAVRAPTAFAAEALLQVARASEAPDPSATERALADYELAADRRLDRTRLLVRAGPALGLMGTLIPLAPGLAALGRGHLATLASDLRTAFAATTVGLVVGTVAYALTVTRTRLYSEDLASLEHALAAKTKDLPRASTAAAADIFRPPLPPPSGLPSAPGRAQRAP